MKKKLSRFILISFTSAFTFAAAVTSTIAWFNTGNDIDFGVGDEGHITATTNGGYFGKLANGTGTYGYSATNPYVISTQKHLYNLAWLQYIGYFNTVKYDANPVVKSIQQCYFTVANDIDMDGMILPPIGTELYPFFGYFNGGGYTISNVKISNDDPTSSTSSFANQIAKPSDSVFSKLPSNYIPRVVGFFGAIGDIHTINESIVPGDYSSFTPSMINVTIKDITVESKTSQTLIGLAAGYVDGNMNGVKVAGESTIDLGSGNKAAISSTITSNLSNYGLVGYTSKEGTSGTFTQKLSEFYDNKDIQTSSGNSWGGSLNFYEFTQRIYSIINGPNVTTTQTNSNYTTTRCYYTYADNYNMVSVGFQQTDLTVTANPTSTTLTYNCNANTVMPFTVYKSNEFSDYSSSSTYAVGDLVIYNNNYYECNTEITVGESFTASKWTQVELNQAKSTNTGYVVGRGSGRSGSVKIASSPEGYLRASLIRSGNSNTTYSGSGNGAYTEILTPISPGSAPTSTGTSDFCVIKDQYNSAAIDANSSSLPTYSSGNTYGSLRNYTIKTTAQLGFDRTKKYAKSRKTLHETLSKSSYVQAIRFNEITASSGNYKDVSNPFKTQINGENKTSSSNSSYRLPSGAVSFNLKNNGYINLFGGNYTNSGGAAGVFFTLYAVNRTSNTNLGTISEIYDVWTNTNESTKEQYPYIYTNAHTTTTPTTNQIISVGYNRNNVTPGEKVFDFRYLTSPSLVTNALYYFEIPVNSGEFCISGISRESGGYLVYLDIGASEIDNKDQITAHWATTIRTGNEYPIGVDFAVNNATGVGGQSIGTFIPATKHDAFVTFEVVTTNGSNKINIIDSQSITTYAFYGSLYSSTGQSGKFVVTGNSPGTIVLPAEGGERELTITITPAGSTTSTIVTVVDLLDADDGFVESQSAYYINGSVSNRATILGLSSELDADLLDKTLRLLHLVATLERSGQNGNEFKATYLEESIHTDYSDGEIDVSIATNGETIGITVENNFKFYINGTQYLTGSTYSSS